MKRIIIATAMVLMSSTVFAKDAPKPVDVDCNKMAMNARGFAELKQGGIASTAEDLQKFVVAPTVASYPIRSVLSYVLDAPDQSPEQVYNSLYNKCTLMGYKDLFTYFTEREEIAGLKVQIAEQNQTIANLKQQVIGVQLENTSLRNPPPVIPPTSRHSRSNAQPVVLAPVVSVTAPLGCTRQDGAPCGSPRK